ncbi:hypothetical protein BW723_11900 [Polaribacter reichenbachii]|uniref:Uncharacterized protein n=1 Tax=Polaribacter reichenbachii TaxID=996801 RepID=A0A1B8TPG1_9FLAO|nr:hypothetical protein [Polaribacter reichenbachii]APZ46943.1 hypothetical protein BW723_11900 [Polaribacter reichenbachii]AUC17586.1 hypothetical protein BTO17_02345 [Polaribacter reichenbachii]OBY61541.1 hypothetical protein LPB301_15875 [Polaribacter reichenbachii]
MKKIINKPYLYFFALIPLYITIGLIKRNVPIDINITYIYYLINVDFWCYVSAVYFSLIGINYVALDWAKKCPKKWLTISHIILQTLAIIPFIYAVLRLDENGLLKGNQFLGILNLEAVLIFSFFLFLLSIFVHLVNFFVSLLLKRE